MALHDMLQLQHSCSQALVAVQTKRGTAANIAVYHVTATGGSGLIRTLSSTGVCSLPSCIAGKAFKCGQPQHKLTDVLSYTTIHGRTATFPEISSWCIDSPVCCPVLPAGAAVACSAGP